MLRSDRRQGRGSCSVIVSILLLMGSDTITSAFRQAVEDKDVKAILFRIDSPGGSYVASDAVWRETVNARKAGKPIIVSMGGTAASGGYFIATAATRSWPSRRPSPDPSACWAGR